MCFLGLPRMLQYEPMKWQLAWLQLPIAPLLSPPCLSAQYIFQYSASFTAFSIYLYIGFKNLKERTIPFDILNQNSLSQFNGTIVCDKPNESLEYWDGNVHSTVLNQVINCNIKNTILRGCTLKNTDYCFGIVLYVGIETKIMKNSKKPPRKVSKLMLMMNYMLYTVFAFQIGLVLLFAGLSQKWTQANATAHKYLHANSSVSFGTFMIQFFTYWVAYSHMIPISLYVIIELLKLGLASHINKDLKMYCTEDGGVYANCRNSDLIEEMGQVEFVFSDKTGTLTQNKMEFKKISVGGVVYGGNGACGEEGMASAEVESIQKQIKEGDKELKSFLRMLSVCHTAVCEKDAKTCQTRYQAASPDELALVMGAKQIGYEVTERTANEIIVTNQLIEKKEAYKVIAEFPFDSTRKRMSLIIQTQEGDYYLYTKGADSIMLPRCVFFSEKDQLIKDKTQKDLYAFAVEGLRTLVFGERILGLQEYNNFSKDYHRIKTSNDADKELQLLDLYDLLEQGLTYVGSTAIEDKLQEGVSDSIAKIIETKIRVWVLTGDKQETAIEIGKSCKLIQTDMRVVILTSDSLDELHSKITEELNVKESTQRLAIVIDGPTLTFAFSDEKTQQEFFGLGLKAASVICCRVSPKQKADVVALAKKNGTWITVAIGDGANDVSMIQEAHIGVSRYSIAQTPSIYNSHENMLNPFQALLSWIGTRQILKFRQAQSREFCHLGRAKGTRLHKILKGSNHWVRIIKSYVNSFSPKGVGIRGKEGTQAVRSADYAISQFRFLDRLLLVHGRLGYKRVSWMVCYYFYKNIILVFTEFYFAFYNGFSGQIYFADWLPMLYNAVWTSWHCLFAYLFESDVSDALAYKYPHSVYSAGQQQRYFSYRVFWKWIILALYHGAVTFFGVQYSISQGSAVSGRQEDHWFTSTTAFTCIVHIIIYKLFIETTNWNVISVSTCLLCFLLYYGVVIIGNLNLFSSTFQPQINGQFFLMVQNPKFWILVIALPLAAIMPDLSIAIGHKIFRPTPVDAVMRKQGERVRVADKKGIVTEAETQRLKLEQSFDYSQKS